jgi:hypothetical protein
LTNAFANASVMAMSRILALPLALGLSLACRTPTADLDAPTPASEPEPPPPIVRPAPPGPGEPGPVYFAVEEKGIVEFDGTNFTLLPDPPPYVQDLLIGPDGSLYVLTLEQLAKREGGQFSTILSFDFEQLGGITSLALAAPDQYFAISFRGVSEWPANHWTVTTKDAIGRNLMRLTAVALGYDGKLWVASEDALHYRDASDRWHPFDISTLEPPPTFYMLETSPTGDIYAQADNYLAKITPGSGTRDLEKIEISGTRASYYSELMFSPDGHVGVASYSCDIARLDPANPDAVWIRHGDSNYGCETLTAAALDGRKRMWVASRTGLNVMGPDAENVAYPSGSVLELVGIVKAIAVVGLGPSPLPPAGPVKTGTLIGKVLRDGTPIAKARLELCPQVADARARTSTPCADSAVELSTTSRKDGSFTFENVPLGNYEIAAEIDGSWATISWLPDFGAQMQEGKTYDIGEVKFD